MLKEERHQYILNQIKQDYRIYITALSEELNISDDTLRRDLIELDEKGLLTKVHGGAIAKSGIPIEFTRRLNIGVSEKIHLAKKTIPLFKSGEILLIDGGTTNLELVRQLPSNLEFTIYTNSFPIVNELIDHPNIELIFFGGNVFSSSRITVGIPVIQALQTFRADWVILGSSNIHPQKGLTVPDREEAFVKRLMVEKGKQRVVLVDSYKLNTEETYCVASLNDIDYLVVEDEKIDYIKDAWSYNFSYTIL
ncbi:HTH-type transcriptional repressor GlcR [termite gut metagenome]|uniref:HTH-type transcriptional repressor GlcR n=1 Tax=termite gut metagenome TaxID=433724 RepID=A0A5J4RB15_9ZZZZ